MGETERITVAETSAGAGATGEPGQDVDLPVVEVLTGRGFATGKSGSGKSNTASVIAENLLDNGFGLLIVDVDGEYYGLKEEYEILHVGDDEECDIQVTVDHAERLASLALEQNVPIILDVSSFLDESEAEELLTEVARHLFAKAKKQKQPFLLLVEEIHEWIPEQGSVGEVGRMLIKIGKRGRKHGLGMVGISQRPADVKKDYITQCDWLVWHRLTWNNDTKVVGRILDSEYAEAVEDLDDGEAFLQTDWADTVRRVQFHRKQTFDAGATPGLDDVERPELKSVSDDLVSELTEISEEQEQRENRIQELRSELDRKNSRIAELEAELQDARDLRHVAEEFTEALMNHVERRNPGRTNQEQARRRRRRIRGPDADESDSGETATPASPSAGSAGEQPSSEPGGQSTAGTATPESPDGDDGPTPGPAVATTGDVSVAATGDADEQSTTMTVGNAAPDGTDDEVVAAAVDAVVNDQEDGATSPDGSRGADAADSDSPTDDASGADATEFPAIDGLAADDAAVDSQADDQSSAAADDGSGADDWDLVDQFPSVGDEGDDQGEAPAARTGTGASESASQPAAAGPGGGHSPAATNGQRGGDEGAIEAGGDSVVATLSSLEATESGGTIQQFPPESLERVHDMDERTRRMLAFYLEQGPDTPRNAYFAAGGAGDRTRAYAHNRRLRTAEFVEHVGCGKYEACLRDRVEADLPPDADEDRIEKVVADLRDAVLDE